MNVDLRIERSSRRRGSILVVLVLAMSVGRCACDDEEPVSDVDLILVPEQQLIDFGDVWMGGDANAIVRVSNVGDATIRFDGVEIVDANGPFTLSSPPPSTLGPDEVLALTVRFAPIALGVVNGAIVVRSDAVNAPTLSVALRGVGVAPPSCDDDNVCTDDAFDVLLGACIHTAAEGTCDDGSSCTTLDRCFDGTCVGEAITCDDGDPCTIDFCGATEGCRTLPDESVCDDDNPCTDDFCLEGGACASVARPNNTVCSEVFSCAGIGLCQSGTCVDFAVPDGTPCSDDDVCTVDDTCVAGACSPGVVSTEPPGITTVTPLLLPTGYPQTLTGAARRFGDRIVQIAPGFASVFDLSTPGGATLLWSHELSVAYDTGRVAMFDDGRVVLVLPVENRVWIFDPSLGDEAPIIEVDLPVVADVHPESAIVSAGDRIVFLWGSAVLVLTSDLLIEPLLELSSTVVGIGGTPSHLFVLTAIQTQERVTHVFDVTGGAPVERATLPFACESVSVEGDRAACVTLREVDGQVFPRIAILDVPSIDAGDPVILVEEPMPHVAPESGLLLVGGDLVLRDHLGSAIVRYDPITGTEVESFPIVGQQITAIDARTLLTTDGELVEADPDAPIGATFTRLAREDLGAVVGASWSTRLVADGDALWILSRSGVARLEIDDGEVTSTYVLPSPLETADGLRAAMIPRVPTGNTTSTTFVPLGGPTTAGFVPVDVSVGPLGPQATRYPAFIAAQTYRVAGNIGLGEGTTFSTSWPLVLLTTLFDANPSMPVLAWLPHGPYGSTPNGVAVSTASDATLSPDGRRVVIGWREQALSPEVLLPSRYVVVDVTSPPIPTIGGFPLGDIALPNVPASGTLDYVPNDGEPITPSLNLPYGLGSTVAVAYWREDGAVHVLAIDVDNALAPTFIARGWVDVALNQAEPWASNLAFVSESGRAFFLRNPGGPHEAAIVSVVPGVNEGDSVVTASLDDVVTLPPYPSKATLVGDAVVVVGLAYIAIITPPCD